MKFYNLTKLNVNIDDVVYDDRGIDYTIYKIIENTIYVNYGYGRGYCMTGIHTMYISNDSDNNEFITVVRLITNSIIRIHNYEIL